MKNTAKGLKSSLSLPLHCPLFHRRVGGFLLYAPHLKKAPWHACCPPPAQPPVPTMGAHVPARWVMGKEARMCLPGEAWGPEHVPSSAHCGVARAQRPQKTDAQDLGAGDGGQVSWASPPPWITLPLSPLYQPARAGSGGSTEIVESLRPLNSAREDSPGPRGRGHTRRVVCVSRNAC